MANETRVRTISRWGLLTDNPLLIGATSANSAEFANLPVIGTSQYMALIFDPGSLTPEIVWVTAHTASSTTVTILRGQEQGFGGLPAKQHPLNTRWIHGPTLYDIAYSKPPHMKVLMRGAYR